MSRLSTSRNFQIPILSQELVAPALPDWMMELPGVARLTDRIGVTEFRRRLFHMSPALLPLGLPFIPHADVWGPILVTILVLTSVVVLGLSIVIGPLVKRQGESTWMQAVLGYMIPVVGALLVFPGRAELGLMTLQILALGDGSATLGGLVLGGRRLPWNRRKTVSGLLCFTFVGTLAATYSYWGEIRPGIPIGSAFLICSVAALCAAVVESLPIRSNDNLRVGLTALLVGIAMSMLVV